MIDYAIDFDAGPVVKRLKKIGADMPEINRRILGLLSEETINNAQQVYITKGGGPPKETLLTWRSGTLAKSLTYRVQNDYAEVGTNLVYAAIHEYGGAIPGGEMPARPYLRPALDELFKSGRAQLIMDREMQRELDRRMA